MRRPWRILSLVGGLALATLVLAQAVSFAVIWAWPAPPAPTMVPADAVAVLAGQAGAGGRGLLVQVRDEPPHGPTVPWLAELAATRLGVPVSAIRACWRSASVPALQVVTNGRLAQAQHDPAGRAQVLSGLLAPGLRLPAFELGVRQRDGRWRVVASADGERALWRRQVAAAFALGALLIAPMAWWLARRLTLPLRRLAQASAQVDLGARAQPLPRQGAREVQALAHAIEDARLRLRAQAADVTALLAAVAHDLRTPLTGLRLRAESAPAPDRERMIADIARMQAMIAQVLDYARGEVGPLQSAPIDVPGLLRELAESACALGQAVRVAPALPSPPLQGDALALRRALANLIDNAVRYAGSAELDVQVRDGALWLDVADRGPGIPAAARARLVQPFQRLEGSRSRDTGGTGLGLAVARSAAQRHGGALQLLDRPGGGLLARIALPLAR